MLSSTVIGVELHRLGLKFNFGQVKVQLGRDGLGLNVLVLLRVQLQLKATSSKSKFNSAAPR